MNEIVVDTNFTVPQLAEYLGCSISMVRKLVRNKKIPHYHIGTHLRFRQSSILNWVARQEQKGACYYE